MFIDKLTLRCLPRNDPALSEVLDLIRHCFAFMDGRIDPPSSIYRLQLTDLNEKANEGWILVAGYPVQACVVATALPHALYLGKMAVHPDLRGAGLAREMVQACEELALQNGLDRLELQVRIELVENQQTFEKLGFHQAELNSHPGYDRITEITMQKKC